MNGQQMQETNMFIRQVLMRSITEEEYQNLKKENIDLQARFLSLTNSERSLQETIKIVNILTDEKNQIKAENDRLIEENKLLKEKIKELEEKNRNSDEKIKSLEKHVNNQDSRINKLECDIKELKNRDEPITIREGIVSLEKYIIMEILGSDFSKSKVRKIQSVHNLFNDPMYMNKCDEFLKKYGLTEDHIYLIPALKENGNKSVHEERPTITRNEFETISQSFFNDDNDKKMTR